MKRYRVLGFDFDSRVILLNQEIHENWDERAKQLHRENKQRILASLAADYGEMDLEQKVKNFIDLGPKRFAILAFHNRFFEQCRRSFVVGAFFPALTAACALGGRILNHLIILLRDDFKGSTEYKEVYRKKSFDNWGTVIDTLESWQVLLPDAVLKFNELCAVRNRSIHFDPAADHNDRELALEAIRLLGEIISDQFSAFGCQP